MTYELITETMLLRLGDLLAEYRGVTHWRISYLIAGNGQLFETIRNGREMRKRTKRHAIEWLGSNWPEDLEWPSDIPRPSAKGRAA